MAREIPEDKESWDKFTSTLESLADEVGLERLMGYCATALIIYSVCFDDATTTITVPEFGEVHVIPTQNDKPAT